MRRIDGKCKWHRAVSVVMCSALLVWMPQTTVKATEGVWDYGYTGGEQEFVAPYTGEYQMELYGAQGGNAAEGGFEGGLGGKVQVTLSLTKGETVTLIVGGQNGYNGGGTGKVSCGGGATDIRINGNRIAIAGGGGGATNHANGGNGGNEAGISNTAYEGASAPDVSGSSGGGGGKNGGNAGYHYYVKEAHSPHTDECYKTIDVKCSGTIGYFDCLTSEMNSEGMIEEQYYLMGYECKKCRHIYAHWRAGEMHSDYDQLDNTPCTQIASTTKKLICDGIQVPYSAVSGGGTSWYDTSICTDGLYEEGRQTKDGACSVKLLKVFQFFFQNAECKKIFYAGTEVKKVYYNGNLIYVR